MSTPQKSGEEVLRDLECTVVATRDLKRVDRWELNISCPNTQHASGGDSRGEYLNQVGSMFAVMNQNIMADQELYVKVSPDMLKEDVPRLIEMAHAYGVRGFTTTNTTTKHDPDYIITPPNSEGRGGASGLAVRGRSMMMQSLFQQELYKKNSNASIIACGGICYAKLLRERTWDFRVEGIQIFTPLVFQGPRLIRELRREANGTSPA